MFKFKSVNLNLKNVFFRRFCVKSKYQIENPYSFEVVGEIAYEDPSKIPLIIENGLSAKSYLSSISLTERISIIENSMSWFKANKEMVAINITNQMGKPLTQSLREVDTMFDRVKHLISIAPQILEEDIIEMDSKNCLKIIKEPVGLALLISPWNYPLLTSASAIVPAILCGNPVLLKHSPKTALCGEMFENSFKNTGATNVLQSVFLKNDDIIRIIKSYHVGYVGFVGSTETGKTVLKNIANESRFLNSSFELGGKDAAYVRRDADIDFAVENLVDGAMYNAGQSCCAIERAYIHKDLYEEFIEKAKDLISKYKLGNPMNADVTMGPLALPESPIKLKEQVDEAVSSGATVVIGGNICNDEFGKGRFFEPTLIRDCSAEMTIMTEESFGPILPVASVEDDNEAISLMNNSDYGLSASIYSKDYHEAETLSAQLEVGTVFLNRCDYCHPLLAWAGRKKSGNGVSLSKYGFNNFYKTKSINFRLPN